MSLPSADSLPLPSPSDAQRTKPSRFARRAGIAGLVTALSALAVAGAPTGSAAGPPAEGGPSVAGTTRSHETPSDVQVTAGHIVTLITGDRVRLTSYSDGRTAATLLTGSPHAGGATQTVTSPAATYVIPKLALPMQRRLDVSLFNVSALAGNRRTTVPVSVRFASGVAPHAIPGLSLSGSQSRTAHGATVVAASYSTASARRGAESTGSWRGVASVSMPGGRAPAGDPAGSKHTLTINVSKPDGSPAGFELAWVQNVDDIRHFFKPVRVVKGVAKVSVPEGDYSVFAGTFARTIIDPDFAVTSDTTINMSLADATVRPSETVPAHTVVEGDLSLQRDSARGGSFGMGIAGDRFVYRVQPVQASLPHGDLYSQVAGVHVPSSERGDRVFSSLAYTSDYRSGVPHDLSFVHPRADFAVMPQKFYAAGPAGIRYASALSFAPFQEFGFSIGYPVRVPSVRQLWLQGSTHLLWDQEFLAIVPHGASQKLATLDKLSRYTPGAALPVNFAHNPVGPGLEAAFDKNRTGSRCLLCRSGSLLHGSMPLFEGAGTAMDGLLWSPRMGSWSLSKGDQRLARGAYLLQPDVRLPAVRTAYTLRADSAPGVPSWQLSTRVSDVWTFLSGPKTGVVPLLMPSYVPRTALDGSLRPGPTRFPLDFGNLGPVDATVTHASVELSTNGGATWRPATLTRVDKNSFAVTYDNPAARGSATTMSLKVTGVDGTGRTVTETALNAYRLVASG